MGYNKSYKKSSANRKAVDEAFFIKDIICTQTSIAAFLISATEASPVANQSSPASMRDSRISYNFSRFA